MALSSTTVKQKGRQRRKPTIWTREKIYKLIELYRASDCLWNHYSELYKNKDCRNKAIDRICKTLEISKIDYGKKVHNLRNQFNSELKKYERRLEKMGGAKNASTKTCRWEHFETLMFLRPIIEPRPGYQPQSKKSVNSIKLSYNENTEQEPAESPIEENKELPNLSVEQSNNRVVKELEPCEVQQNSTSKHCKSFSSISTHVEKQNCMEVPRPGVRDQWDAFGELIANEFRNLNSMISRKKLKRKIMQIMLEVGEEDDKKYTNMN
ncbi:PREDICTED: uncharacterized protein LOC108617622 [Drosophila arizonae]|uniref:Uncharacterized protein LOC108617622 n=1 Tax=Drosophila arizonae TaxID=7263 RepID=A0ABM1PP17_DROAR|nr:PREDICTED: uncharacterized protein LOC108617622 [Drosophila arizonae]